MKCNDDLRIQKIEMKQEPKRYILKSLSFSIFFFNLQFLNTKAPSKRRNKGYTNCKTEQVFSLQCAMSAK